MNEQIQQYLKELAESLGVAVSHVYEVIVRQTVVNGIVWSVVNLLVLIAVIAFSVWLVKFIIKHLEWILDTDLEIAIFLGGAILGFGVFIVVICTLAALPSDIMSIFNPEYYAIKDILSALRGGE